MTPSNQPSKEAAAVIKAFGIKTDQPDPNANGGADPNPPKTETTTEQKADNTQAPEQKRATGKKIIEVGKTKEVKEAKTEPKAKAAEKTEFDTEKYLGEMFGLNSAQIKELQQRSKDQEQLLSKSPYKSKEVELLDELIGDRKMDFETAVQYLRADPTKMTPLEVMVFAMKTEMPGIAPEKIEARIKRQYKIGEYAVGETPEEKEANEKVGLDDLEIDAQKHIKGFQELKDKMVTGQDTRNLLASQQTERNRLANWKPAAESIFGDFKSIDVEAPNGNVFRYNIEMAPEERKQLLDEFNTMIQNPSFVADEEGIKNASEALRTRYIGLNFNKIALAIAQQARTMNEEEWIEAIHNPSLANTSSRSPAAGPKGDRDDAIFNAIEKAERGNRKR